MLIESSWWAPRSELVTITTFFVLDWILNFDKHLPSALKPLKHSKKICNPLCLQVPILFVKSVKQIKHSGFVGEKRK